MIKVNPRLAILGNSSNMVSNTLRYLCFILNSLWENNGQHFNVKENMNEYMDNTLRGVRIKSVPKQLKGSENYDEIKRLHIKGESDQTQEGEHCHWEVKPERTKNKNTESVFDTCSETFLIYFYTQKKKTQQNDSTFNKSTESRWYTSTASLDLCMLVF